MNLVSDKHREQLVALLADLREKNPEIRDLFRMSRGGSAVCMLRPGEPRSIMLYSVYLGAENVVFCGSPDNKYPSLDNAEVEDPS
jgi:hypothetical protein